MAELYDLIFIGIDAKETNRKATINSISKLLEVDTKEIEYLIDNKLSAVIKQALPVSAVRKYQNEMARLGAICNYRPSQFDGSTLELAPVEMPSQQFVFTCPACDHKHSVAHEEDLPISCPACGIIPSKYEKVSGYKQAHGIAAKQNPANLREQLPQDLAGAPASAAVRQYPHSQEHSLTSAMTNVWLESNLPKKPANSGLMRFASGGVLWLLGVAMGGAAVSAYYELKLQGKAQRPRAAEVSPAIPEAPTPQPEPAPENNP
jgi:hypothetical protein